MIKRSKAGVLCSSSFMKRSQQLATPLTPPPSPPIPRGVSLDASVHPHVQEQVALDGCALHDNRGGGEAARELRERLGRLPYLAVHLDVVAAEFGNICKKQNFL